MDLALPAGSPADGSASQVEVGLEIEANLTVGGPGQERTHYVRERWRLVRDAGVRSKPPEKVRTFQCPNCGAPFGSQGTDRCEYCGQVTSGGRFDWSVESIVLLSSEERPPAGSDVQEVGTSWPTIFIRQGGPRRERRVIRAGPKGARRPPGPDDAGAERGMDCRRPPRIRPFVSDSLFAYLRYWIETYERQGLRNVLEGMHIVRWQMAKVVRDRYYDAVTLRIWGSGKDYLVRKAKGERVSGDPRRERAYSEYWTLLRGAAVRGAPRADKACPNCGATLEVNMAGECAHCGSKVASGDLTGPVASSRTSSSLTDLASCTRRRGPSARRPECALVLPWSPPGRRPACHVREDLPWGRTPQVGAMLLPPGSPGSPGADLP